MSTSRTALSSSSSSSSSPPPLQGSGISYTPLDDSRDEIRVVKILPTQADGSRHGEVHCELRVVSLSDKAELYLVCEHMAQMFNQGNSLGYWKEMCETIKDMNLPPTSRYTWGDYVALSYTWGDATVRQDVIMDGRPISVTDNLYQALRCLRHNVAGILEGVYVWIDALCINQDDLDEKASQICKMETIYSGSLMTYSFLAGMDDEAHLANEILQQIVQNREKTMADAMGLLRASGPETSNEHQDKWGAFYRFITHPYWHRLWIIQELLLSYPLNEILFGDCSVKAKDVYEAVSSMHGCVVALTESLNSVAPEQSWLPSVDRIMDLFSALRRAQLETSFGSEKVLAGVLKLSRDSSQKEIKDKVYGILGVVARTVQERISVDYHLPLSVSLTQFTKAVVEVHGSLDVLRLVNSGLAFMSSWDFHRETPSWVVDFASPESPDAILDILPQKASRNVGTTVTFGDHDQTLICSGFVFDAIDGLSCSIKGRVNYQDDVVPSKNSFSIYGSVSSTAEAIMKAFLVIPSPPEEWITLLQKLTPNRRHLQEMLTTADGDSQLWLWLKDFVVENRHFDVLGESITDWLLGWVDKTRPPGSDFSKQELNDVKQVLSLTVNTMQKHRMITTESGRVGWTVMCAEQGDVIALIVGCDAPLVLRPKGECYVVVGECYLQGVMDGEAMVWLDSGERSAGRIKLC